MLYRTYLDSSPNRNAAEEAKLFAETHTDDEVEEFFITLINRAFQAGKRDNEEIMHHLIARTEVKESKQRKWIINHKCISKAFSLTDCNSRLRLRIKEIYNKRKTTKKIRPKIRFFPDISEKTYLCLSTTDIVTAKR